jgi:uncharacterized protein YgiM (DUF1202 family)
MVSARRRHRTASPRALPAAALLVLVSALSVGPARPAPAASPGEPPAASDPARGQAPAAGEQPPERAWVRGELRLNFRASPSSESTPLGIVTTGDEVQVLERRGGWARIQVDENPPGWLPDSMLAPEPPPTKQLAELQGRVKELQSSLDAATRDAATQREALEKVRAADAGREDAMRRLTEENRDLRAGERWPYLVTGAGLLGIGIAVGILLRGPSRRPSSRIRF